MASRLLEVKSALQDSVDRLVLDLLPGGKRSGGNYTVKSPVRHDRRAGSFVVWLTGPAKGCFKDYADDSAKGDIIDLIALCKGMGKDRSAALAWAEDWLGWKKMSKADRAKYIKEIKKREKLEKAKDDRRQQYLIQQAQKTWNKTLPIEGSLGEVYFKHRGIPLDEIRNRTDFCHFLPEAEYWLLADYEFEGGKRKKVKAGPTFPAIVSRMDNIDGHLQALHYTFIAPDGCGKAPIEDQSKAKLMFPRTAGAAIWMTRGKGNLNPDTMVARKLAAPGVIGEGIEDGLSVALGVPEARVLAAGSLPNLLTFPLHPCFNSFVLLKDNDWNKPEAQALFDRAFQRVKRAGYPVEVVSSNCGKDMNDLLGGV
ncbi:DUF7146 domain-containing protein [Cohaesibacter gelatinilyticus]|uniref:Toprim domain-containing protein n=1 Tax=Cohaesibacter gelatinilyticus TaxID=372072 RepID=A0A285PI32_9HYPH|nr:toprim domain-containing protein [Cohaesibacter gelatinilyticus]SNZ20933.1 Toprim domain-containing protein [Cohaesibacter gelatinilyticus]